MTDFLNERTLFLPEATLSLIEIYAPEYDLYFVIYLLFFLLLRVFIYVSMIFPLRGVPIILSPNVTNVYVVSVEYLITDMVQSMRFRFGRIELPEEELPTPTELNDAIDDTWRERDKKPVVEGEDPVSLEEKGMNSYLDNSKEDHSFCQFTYVSDKENSATVREGDNLKVAPDDQPVRPLAFYFKNGQFAYESEDGLNRHWIPQFIGERTDVTVESPTFYDFSQQIMRDFYDTRDEITLFKFGSTDKELNTDSDIARALNELANEVSSQEFSGGNPPKNLKGLDIFEEAKEQMRILRLKGFIGDGYTNEILRSGMYQVKWDESDWPSDAGQSRRADAIYNRIAPYLRRLE